MWRLCTAAFAVLVQPLFFPDIGAGAERVEKPQRPGCSIKGNVSRNGRLYFVPGHPHYDAVRMNKPDERWFCSEDEARRAGWTVAKSFRPGPPVHDEADRTRPDDADVPCAEPIKGNVTIGSNGKRVGRYHEFGSPRYAETVVRKAAGDRYFCTVHEAEAAGFEKAGTFIGRSGHDQRDCEVPIDIPDDARQRRAYIKGNISDAGRIFHEPGTQHYAETQITLQRGERWFVSIEEARNAGWRAPLGGGKKLTCALAQAGLR